MIYPISKLLWLFPGVVVSAFCYRLSVSYGELEGRSCLYAIILSFLGVICGGLPAMIISDVKPEKVFAAFLAGLVMRLFVVMFGSVIVLHFLETDVLWFVGWLGFFYLIVLVIETYYSVMLLRRSSEVNLRNGY